MEVEKLASKKEGGPDKKRKKIDDDGSDDLQVDATSKVAGGPVDIKDSEIDSKPQQRYGHGFEGTLCDVCFMGEGEGEISFIKCRECLLVVHSDCYFADGAMRIDDKGFFDCDRLARRVFALTLSSYAVLRTNAMHISIHFVPSFPIESALLLQWTKAKLFNIDVQSIATAGYMHIAA